MDATLSLHDSRMTAEDIQDLTAKLLRSIRQETDLAAVLPQQPGGPKDKGDLSMIGEIALAALSSGAVTALLQVLQAYFDRHPSLKMEIKAADGRELKIEAARYSAEQIAQLMQEAKHFCDE